MAALPPGWELDYDGSRWIYRFTASGLTQYQFPKPGDEFPEFVGADGFWGMAPEDCLASDKQVKRQTMQEMGAGPAKPPAVQRKKSSLEDIKEVEAAEYLDTEKFMYLGPGSFSGSNPLGGQQARIKLEAKHSDPERQPTSLPTKQRGEDMKEPLAGRPIAHYSVDGGFGAAQGQRPEATADASKEAEPREGSAITAPSVQTKLRMQSPVGFVAELASHETRKQADHMSNAESAVADRPMAGGLGQQLDGPVELPAHGKPMKTKQARLQETRVASAPLADSYPLVSASFAFPPLPPRRPIDLLKTAGFSQSAIPARKPSSQEMARPLSCHEAPTAKGSHPGGKPNGDEGRFASMPELPTLTRLAGVAPPNPKRHSIQGPRPAVELPSRHPISTMPPSDLDKPDSPGVINFQNRDPTYTAPCVPPKIPLSPGDVRPDSLINSTSRTPAASQARHESVSLDSGRAYTSSLPSTGLVQCPSVLRPGYYRSSAIGPPQPSRQSVALAASERQQLHHQHLPHIRPVQHSRHTPQHASLQAPVKPRWCSEHRLEGPAVRMPDERDFAVRPTPAARAASEPALVSSPTTVSSPRSPSGGPGLMIFHEIGPAGPQREPKPDTTTSRPGKPWTKDIHELGGDGPLPVELPAYEGTETKPAQPPPFVAPLRLSPSAGRLRGELPPSVASAAQELAAVSLLQQEHSWSAPDLSNTAQAGSHTRCRMSGSTSSRASLPGPQDPSPLTRPASLAQSDVSSPSASNASLHQVPISTSTSGLPLCEAPSTRPSALETVPRYVNKETRARGQQVAELPPHTVKARGKGAWSISSANYSGDEWGHDWYEECPGVVPEDYLPK